LAGGGSERLWVRMVSLMVNLIPDLELVIGKQPPVSEIPPQDAQNRFQLVFRRFSRRVRPAGAPRLAFVPR